MKGIERVKAECDAWCKKRHITDPDKINYLKDMAVKSYRKMPIPDRENWTLAQVVA